ncbi:MAG: hypothetical protein OXU20_06210 [Myxococcales bacterium]|nr:hypothetical protein [Myxococcales bacterium]
MHPFLGLEALKYFAMKVPSNWLCALFAVAMLRFDGSYRSADSRRARSILTLGVLLWFLARPTKRGGQWGYVVRGLPAGAFLALLGWYEHWGMRRRQPAKTTVYGTHRVGGRFDRAEVGYFAALVQAGLLRVLQLPWDQVKPEHRGPMRINDKGEIQCWAFSEIFLRIPTPGLTPLELGPPPLQRRVLPPPPEAMAPVMVEPSEPVLVGAVATLPSEAPATTLAAAASSILSRSASPEEALLRDLEAARTPAPKPAPARSSSPYSPYGWRGPTPTGDDLTRALLEEVAKVLPGGSDPPSTT